MVPTPEMVLMSTPEVVPTPEAVLTLVPTQEVAPTLEAVLTQEAVPKPEVVSTPEVVLTPEVVSTPEAVPTPEVVPIPEAVLTLVPTAGVTLEALSTLVAVPRISGLVADPAAVIVSYNHFVYKCCQSALPPTFLPPSRSFPPPPSEPYSLPPYRHPCV